MLAVNDPDIHNGYTYSIGNVRTVRHHLTLYICTVHPLRVDTGYKQFEGVDAALYRRVERQIRSVEHARRRLAARSILAFAILHPLLNPAQDILRRVWHKLLAGTATAVQAELHLATQCKISVVKSDSSGGIRTRPA